MKYELRLSLYVYFFIFVYINVRQKQHKHYPYGQISHSALKIYHLQSIIQNMPLACTVPFLFTLKSQSRAQHAQVSATKMSSSCIPTPIFVQLSPSHLWLSLPETLVYSSPQAVRLEPAMKEHTKQEKIKDREI